MDTASTERPFPGQIGSTVLSRHTTSGGRATMIRTISTISSAVGERASIGIHRPSAAPIVSVVIPVFNEAQSLPSLLDQLLAVLRGEDLSFEIIAVNDGSSDDSLEVLRHFAE